MNLTKLKINLFKATFKKNKRPNQYMKNQRAKNCMNNFLYQLPGQPKNILEKPREN